MSQNQKKRRGLPSQTGLFFRLIVGVYIIYLAYSIVKDLNSVTGPELILFIVFAIIFVVAGLTILATTGKALKDGRYLNGAMDLEAKRKVEKDTGEIVEEKKKRIRFNEEDEI